MKVRLAPLDKGTPAGRGKPVVMYILFPRLACPSCPFIVGPSSSARSAGRLRGRRDAAWLAGCVLASWVARRSSVSVPPCSSSALLRLSPSACLAMSKEAVVDPKAPALRQSPDRQPEEHSSRRRATPSDSAGTRTRAHTRHTSDRGWRGTRVEGGGWRMWAGLAWHALSTVPGLTLSLLSPLLSLSGNCLAPLPTTRRGYGVVLNASPKEAKMIYTNGRVVVIRSLAVSRERGTGRGGGNRTFCLLTRSADGGSRAIAHRRACALHLFVFLLSSCLPSSRRCPARILPSRPCSPSTRRT